MATKLSLINRAMSDLGMASYVFDLSPEEIQDCLNRLDDMMAEWDFKGIRLGYALPSEENPSSPDDDAHLPDGVVSAVASNLAIRCAPMFGKQVSPDVYKQAKDGLDVIEIATMQMPSMQYPTTMPRGGGYKNRFMYDRFYWPTNPLRVENDGELK